MNRYLVEFVVTGYMYIEAEDKHEAGRIGGRIKPSEVAALMKSTDAEVDQVLLHEGKEPVDGDISTEE